MVSTTVMDPIMRSSGRSILLLAALASLAAAPASAEQQTIVVFDSAVIGWERDLPEGTVREGLVLRDGGQTIELVADLPPVPANQRDARRILAQVDVEPILTDPDGKRRPVDPWTRLGSINVLTTDKATGKAIPAEMLRFITAFGGPSSYTQDLTALAPLLAGRTTLRASISTWSPSAWRVTLKLTYSTDGVGYRRPVFALPVFLEPKVTSDNSRLLTRITVPPNLDRPRLRILTTGHASDGAGGDEFVARTHILRIDGREVARWRPWAEDAGLLRPANPTSGRRVIDGRELWSCDLDRSGWLPGSVVDPLFIPLRELAIPGEHQVELEILDIRPESGDGEKRGRGYWRVSAILVADEHWPASKDGEVRDKRRGN